MSFNRLIAGMTAAALWAVFSCPAHAESGIASIYGKGDGYAWKPMANGQLMNPGKLIAAHKTLPLGSKVTVTHQGNGRSVAVTILDRGPFIRGRVIDLSPAAARALGCDGLCRVTVQ